MKYEGDRIRPPSPRPSPPGENSPNFLTRIAPINRGEGTLLRHGWRLFPLTPALSLGERENYRPAQSHPMIPVVGRFTVPGQGELAAGSPCGEGGRGRKVQTGTRRARSDAPYQENTGGNMRKRPKITLNHTAGRWKKAVSNN